MAKSKKTSGAYGFGRLIDLILAIIPVTNVIIGIVKRATTGHLLGAVLNFFLAPIFYIVDLVTVIVYNKLMLLA